MDEFFKRARSVSNGSLEPGAMAVVEDQVDVLELWQHRPRAHQEIFWWGLVFTLGGLPFTGRL